MAQTKIQHDSEKLLALLSEKGWTGADLARKTGISQPSIWDLLNGVTKMPKANTLIAVANALGVPLKEILKHPAGKRGAGEDLSEEMQATFAALDPKNQRAILAAARALLGPPK